MTRRYEQIDDQKDSSFYIFDVMFLISVNQLDITTSDYIEQLGFVDSGDSGINREIAKECIQTQASIATMVDYIKKGISFHIVNSEDTVVIHEYIQHHLERFARKMSGNQRLNRNAYPIDDLLSLEHLADKVYGHAKFLETGVDERGFFEKMLESAGLIGFFSGSGEKSEEEIADLPENRERESFADVFKKKQQTLDQNGNKVIDNSRDSFLRIESVQKGISNRFNGQISIEKIDNTNSTILQGREVININTNESSSAESVLSIGILDDEVKLKTGILKAQIENLSSVSGNNKYQDYLDKLDTFVATLSDITDKYIKNGTDDYTYGENLSDAQFPGTINNIGLFSGSTVKTFKFDESAVDSLTQNKLDYLATIQWKKDFNFNEKTGEGTDLTKTSLLEYIRELKVSVSTNKEDAKFFNDTQKNVKLSIENSYNQLTKVDKDEELLNLMKFQATYTANAKIVTAIDEMIQTLLGLKR